MNLGTRAARTSLVTVDQQAGPLTEAHHQKGDGLESKNRSRAFRLMIAFLILLGVVYTLRVGPPSMYAAWGFDSSISLVTAKALSEGRGFRLINHPDSPVSPYVSIGYPALLALGLRFVSLDEIGITVLRAISVITCLLFLLAGYHLLRRYVSPKAAAVAMLFVGLQPWVVVWSGELFRECPFAMLATAAVLLARKSIAEESEHERRWWLNIGAAGLLAGLAVLTHTLGLALLAGMAVALVANRKWRKLSVLTLSSKLIVLPWVVWSALSVGSGSSLSNYYHWAVNYYHWWTPFTNLWRLFSQEAAIILFPPYGTPDGQFLLGQLHISWLFPALSLIAGAIFLKGLIALLKQRDVAAWCLVFYLTLVVLYPAGMTRYLMPAYVLMAIPLMTGVKLLRQQQRPRIPSRALSVTLATMLIFMALGSLITNSLRISGVYTFGNFYGAWGAKDWRELTTAFDWIKENVPQDGIVVTLYSCSTYLFTDRLTISPYHDATDSKTQPASVARLEEVLAKVPAGTPVFVFARPFNLESEEISVTAVKGFVNEHPDQARLRWETPDHKMMIYEVIQPGRLLSRLR